MTKSKAQLAKKDGPISPDLYLEMGTPGIHQYMGFIQEAYTTELSWPSCQPIYSRMRRSDPEVSIVREVFTSLARGISVKWELADNPTDDDKAAQEFAEQSLEDLEGGPSKFIDTMISHVPFYGWGWWEAVPGVRSVKWKNPDKEDPWQSQFNDGKVAFRRLAFRDSSSFWSWGIDDRGRLLGMNQNDFPHPTVFLPIDQSVHLTFGDSNNPEGLSPLEAMWRLERIKYGLEIIQGIGFEHAAGYVDVKLENTSNPETNTMIATAARNILTAKEGNYAIWPKGVTGSVANVDFSAAASILAAIQYYGVLKLTLFGMQWVALSATTGAGSYASMSDSSGMAVLIFNGMLDGFASQLDAQYGRRLFEMNPGAFPNMTKRPRLTLTHVEKNISLQELGAFAQAMKNVMTLGDDDFKAIRRAGKVLPETLPEVVSTPAPPAAPPTVALPADQQPVTNQAAAMAERQRYWTGVLLQHPELRTNGHG